MSRRQLRLLLWCAGGYFVGKSLVIIGVYLWSLQ